MTRRGLELTLSGIGAALVGVCLTAFAPSVWAGADWAMLICFGVVGVVAPLVSRTVWVVALIQVLAGILSPLAWPSAWITLSTAMRRGQLAAATSITLASVGVSVLAGSLTLPALVGAQTTLLVNGALIGLAIGALLLALIVGYLGSYFRAQSAQAALERIRERDEVIRRVENARAAERERLTNELHDTLGSRLALIGALLAADEGPTVSTEAQLHVNKAGEELHALISQRHGKPASATVDRMRELFAEARRAGLRLSVNLDGIDAIGSRYQSLVFELFREGITNALKYASPGVVVAVGKVSDGMLDALISSPATAGVGQTHSSGGTGLRALTEKTASMGGTLEHGATAGRFTLRLRLPLEAVSE